MCYFKSSDDMVYLIWSWLKELMMLFSLSQRTETCCRETVRTTSSLKTNQSIKAEKYWLQEFTHTSAVKKTASYLPWLVALHYRVNPEAMAVTRRWMFSKNIFSDDSWICDIISEPLGSGQKYKSQILVNQNTEAVCSISGCSQRLSSSLGARSCF